MAAGGQPLNRILAVDDPALGVFAPQPPQPRSGGLRLERFPTAVVDSLRDRIGPFANARSSSGCALLLRSDAPWIELQLERLRHHQSAPVGIDLEVCLGGETRVVHSGDLREHEGSVALRLPTGLERGGELAELRIWLPLISTCTVAGLVLPAGSRVEAATVPEPHWLAIGDSLTQGFSVGEPTRHWLHRVARARDWAPAWNCGLGGMTIDGEPFAWALEQRPWRLITIGLGSNHAWRDADAKRVQPAAEALLVQLQASCPQARLSWLMPPWKALEAERGPRDFMGVPLDHRAARRLERIRADLLEVLAAHPRVLVAEQLMPADHRLLPDGLHPGAPGMAAYARALLAQLPE